MARSKSSRRWLKEHFDDPFVKMAQEQNFRSRAAFKLEELCQKDQLLRPDMTVVDLGAAPGGWSQYVARVLKNRARIVAMDILPMEALEGVEFIQGDFHDQEVLDQLLQTMNGKEVNLVLSDMAPNISGQGVVDQARSMYLCELALDFAKQTSAKGANFVCKVFQGQGFDEFMREVKLLYKTVKIRKPKASRDRSKEVYVVALGFRGRAE